MTIVTKVGVSYIDHMSLNDDTVEVDSFSHRCYHAGSLLPALFEEKASLHSIYRPAGKLISLWYIISAALRVHA